jgi:branched-chain amino acid transport system ATP-binding protein
LIDKSLKEMHHLVGQRRMMEKGRIVWHGTSQELLDQPALVNQYLGV